MSNIFQDVLNDSQGVQNELLGPTYPYYDNIKSPSQIGMSSDGTMSALGNDINGLIEYVEVLVSGNGASTTGGPLGNKFFLKTGAKCVANDASNSQVDRYIYIDNVPSGNIPFISSAMGTDFSELKGLIPGSMGNLNAINPYAIMQAFLSGATPNCQQITMQTIDNSNNVSSETQYVTVTDIQNMDPCIFPGGKNPITNQKCKESFHTGVAENASPVLPQDPLAQVYFASLSLIGIYILYCFMEKSR